MIKGLFIEESITPPLNKELREEIVEILAHFTQYTKEQMDKTILKDINLYDIINKLGPNDS